MPAARAARWLGSREVQDNYFSKKNGPFRDKAVSMREMEVRCFCRWMTWNLPVDRFRPVTARPYWTGLQVSPLRRALMTWWVSYGTNTCRILCKQCLACKECTPVQSPARWGSNVSLALNVAGLIFPDWRVMFTRKWCTGFASVSPRHVAITLSAEIACRITRKWVGLVVTSSLPPATPR